MLFDDIFLENIKFTNKNIIADGKKYKIYYTYAGKNDAKDYNDNNPILPDRTIKITQFDKKSDFIETEYIDELNDKNIIAVTDYYKGPAIFIMPGSSYYNDIKKFM